MKKLIVGLTFAVLAATAMALPTEKEVQAAAGSGNYAQAESMMKEVVTARPGSAKAHYLYAELLAHNGKFALASDQTRLARQADPTLAFTDAEKFRSFEQLLQREQSRSSAANTAATAATTAPSASPAPGPVVTRQAAAPQPEVQRATSGIPTWVWLVGILGIGALLWRGFSKSRAAGAAAAGMPAAGMAAPGAPYGMPPGGGMQPGMQAGSGQPYAMNNQQMPYGPGMQQPQAGRGSSMLGTGLAVGGGLAGGMLINEMLHRRADGAAAHEAGAAGAADPGNNAFAGLQPNDDPFVRELEARPIDYGNGDSWDAGGGDAGGFASSDDGSSAGGDDWS